MAVISRVEISALDPTKRIDAEYYQPVYLAEERLLGNTRRKQLRHYGDFITGPFGSEFNVENYAKDTIYRYVRGKDVKPFQIANDDNVYIPKNADKVHLLQLIPQGRANNMKNINVSLSGCDCSSCNHKVLQADGQIVEAPCKKKY